MSSAGRWTCKDDDDELDAQPNAYQYGYGDPADWLDLDGATPEGAAIGASLGSGAGAIAGTIIGGMIGGTAGAAGGAVVATATAGPGPGTTAGAVAGGIAVANAGVLVGAGYGVAYGAIGGGLLGDIISNALESRDNGSAGGAEHKSKARPSTKQKHQEGVAQKKKSRDGEKADLNGRRCLPRKRPKNREGPWPE